MLSLHEAHMSCFWMMASTERPRPNNEVLLTSLNNTTHVNNGSSTVFIHVPSLCNTSTVLTYYTAESLQD